VFYHLLSGRPPFLGGTAFEIVHQLLETEPRPPRLLNPKVDRDLSTICLKCLEKDPAYRYQSALALAEDIEHWLRHEPIRARPIDPITRGKKWVQRNLALTVAGLSLFGLIAAVGVMVWNSSLISHVPASGLAVLPFDNLSGNKDDAFLAVGIQDDILTKLAKIADLKVISRTSVMGYRGARNVPQIGRALNVSHVLEGSVRRNGSRIHLNTQLIDTRSDQHVWAEEYDRDLNDMFAIQSEIAQKVAEQLHVQISPAEKVAINRRTTSDSAAYDLYARAEDVFQRASTSNRGKVDLLEAADLLNQAVARDPSFAEAFCQLARVHDLLYYLGHDHTPARLGLAERSLETANRLAPDAGETHLARAEHLFRGYLNYSGALAELKVADYSLPNDSRLFELRGLIERRQGNQEAGLRSLKRALELDPRNVALLDQIANSYGYLRRYAECEAICDRILALEPDNIQANAGRAWIAVAARGDTAPVHQLIDTLRATDPARLNYIADTWVAVALSERDPAAAEAALITAGDNKPLNDNAVHFDRHFVEGLIARLRHDESKAHAAFLAARAAQEKIVKSQPDYAPPLCVLGVIDAALGRKENALREGRRAMELLPLEKDAINGPLMIEYSAVAAAWVGEKDLAFELLASATELPNGPHYGELKLLPFWDPLRGDPRFEQIVDSLASE
jgi:serine/threonine-protein kinase